MEPLGNDVKDGSGQTVKADVLRLRENELQRIEPSTDRDRGTAYYYPGSVHFAFVVPPRSECRGIRKRFQNREEHAEIKKSCRNIFGRDRFSGRGKGRRVFFDRKKSRGGGRGRDVPDMYSNLGPRVNRGRRGVTPYSPHAETLPKDHDKLQCLALAMEEVAMKYMPADECYAITKAFDASPWPTFRAKEKMNRSGKKLRQCRIFAGFNVSSGSFHNAHIDPDFTYSVVTLFDPDYGCRDDGDPVRYFCFPRLGIAMGLLPGDVIIFNPQEYHCSSSMSVERQVYGLTCFLKTAHVGLNDNSLKLTPFLRLIRKFIQEREECTEEEKEEEERELED